MEKTLTIDGKQVRFKVTAGTMVRYKRQFQKEFLSDCNRMLSWIDYENETVDVNNMDLDVFYQVCWAAAKTADDGIPELLSWLDQFEEFDVFRIFNEIVPMLNGFMKTDAKNA